MRWLLALVGLTMGCDAFGLGEVTQIELDLVVPITLTLPPEGTQPAPMAVQAPLLFREEIDLLETLRAEGRSDVADTLTDLRSSIRRIDLLAVTYEVFEPNGLRADISPILLAMGPLTGETEPGLLGSTVAVPKRRSIALRELDYVSGGLERASPLIEALGFVMVADTVLSIPKGTRVEAGQFALRMQLKLHIEADLPL